LCTIVTLVNSTADYVVSKYIDTALESVFKYFCRKNEAVSSKCGRFSVPMVKLPTTLKPMSLPPALSPEARQAALVKAAVARKARAELKDRLKMGSLTLREVLDSGDSDEVVGKTKMLTVLESLPGLGKVKARRLLDEIGIADTRRVKGLGDNQRARLLEVIEGH
jgi:hypothetical protein